MSDWIEAEQRIERAHQLYESQKWEEALAELDGALQIDPRNGPWHAHRGCVLDQLGRYDEAITAYRVALRFVPADRDVMMALGVDLVRVGRFAKARQVFAEVLEQWPDFEPAYCPSIIAFAELGDFEQAEQCFYLARQLRDECPHCCYYLGWAKFRQQDYSRALFAWHKALALEPAYPGVKRHIAECHRCMGDIDRARDLYLEALREDPGDTDMLKDFADMLADAGRFDAALEKYRLITELEPDYVSAHVAIGEIALGAARLDDAIEAFRTALRIEPTYPGLHSRLGEALLRQGRLEEARRHLSVELERNPDDAQALMTMGNCLLEMGRPTAAGFCYRRLIHKHPDAAGPHHNLAVCCFVRGRFEEGIRHCRMALEIRPNYVLAMHKLALAWLHTGRIDRATQIITRALSVDPGNAAIRQLQSRLLWFRYARYLRRLLYPVRAAARWLRRRTEP